MDIMKHVHSFKITRTYYKTSKYSLVLFIPPVELIYSQERKNYNVNPNAILYLSLNKRYEQNKGKSFEIRQHNQRRILHALSIALNWFTQYNDLFIYGKDGALYFNPEYKDLVSTYRSQYYETPQALKIIPLALEFANGVYEEGVRVYLNTEETFMDLTVSELEYLFDDLMQFNFASEIQITYQAVLLAYNTGNIISTEEKSRSYNFGSFN